MSIFLVTVNILAGLFLIGVVLLQSGKGADMGAAFGGASSTVFGPSGAGNLLTKLTAATAAAFMLSSLALAVVSSRQGSVFDDISEPVAQAPPPIVPVEQPASAASEQVGDETPAQAATAVETAGEVVETAPEVEVPPASPAGGVAEKVDEGAGQQ